VQREKDVSPKYPKIYVCCRQEKTVSRALVPTPKSNRVAHFLSVATGRLFDGAA
jgi:hypothetical protein